MRSAPRKINPRAMAALGRALQRARLLAQHAGSQTRAAAPLLGDAFKVSIPARKQLALKAYQISRYNTSQISRPILNKSVQMPSHAFNTYFIGSTGPQYDYERIAVKRTTNSLKHSPKGKIETREANAMIIFSQNIQRDIEASAVKFIEEAIRERLSDTSKENKEEDREMTALDGILIGLKIEGKMDNAYPKDPGDSWYVRVCDVSAPDAMNLLTEPLSAKDDVPLLIVTIPWRGAQRQVVVALSVREVGM